MAHTTGFNKKMAELVYDVHEGDKIRITELKDSYSHDYAGREGFVEHIDDIGQLHGTWGGLAVIPGTDKFDVLEHHELAGKIYLFSFKITSDVTEYGRIHIFAGSSSRANEIYAENYRDKPYISMRLVREATREEYEEIENTGAPAPKKIGGLR